MRNVGRPLLHWHFVLRIPQLYFVLNLTEEHLHLLQLLGKRICVVYLIKIHHESGPPCGMSVVTVWSVVGASRPAGAPQAKRLLVLGDGGGSKSATQYLCKEDLQGLANRLGLEIRVAHYPPYCSKHNVIEHRVFPHITRACQGVIFHTVRHCTAMHRIVRRRPLACAVTGAEPRQGMPNRTHIRR